jgi:tetratricopeptide (TPR) repeat protein
MFLRLLVCLTFCFCATFNFAQSKFDVIKKIEKARDLWYTGKLDESLKTSKKALVLANKLDNDSLRGLIYNEIEIVYDYKGDYVEGIENFYKAQKYLTKVNDKKNLAYVYSNMGLIYYASGDYPLSLSC